MVWPSRDQDTTLGFVRSLNNTNAITTRLDESLSSFSLLTSEPVLASSILIVASKSSMSSKSNMASTT